MKIAYYYHVPLLISELKDYYFPEFVGKYIEALSQKVEKLTLIVHSEQGRGEYKLKSSNIDVIDLGSVKPAWYRHFFHRRILRKALAELDVDVIIIRSPTPLSLFISKYVNKKIKILYYVVGSYQSGAKEMSLLRLRDIFIKMYLYWYTLNFKRVVREGKVIVNSPKLVSDFSKQLGVIEVIPSSVLLPGDFYQRIDTCKHEIKKLLYVGRLESQKGIYELLMAFSQISRGKVKYELHFVGETNDYSKNLFENLDEAIFPNEIKKNIFFHGFKRSGSELNSFYRAADILILPSYHEGLPRVILEAMANSLPVIATNVGSIPMIFKNKQNIVLIPPKSESAISNAVEEVLFSEPMRKQMIILGENVARQYTLDSSIEKMMKCLNSLCKGK
jgi:glycosyltransferase involved in cell wall biosynthesis